MGSVRSQSGQHCPLKLVQKLVKMWHIPCDDSKYVRICESASRWLPLPQRCGSLFVG